jgi:Xaa-Pro aminopeptidase
MKPVAAPRVADTEVFRARRARVLDAMRAAGGGLAIVPTAPEVMRSRDSEFPYRPDSYFRYLTGFTEPGALLALDANTGASVLFCRAKDPDHEIWEGYRWGPDAAREAFGVDATHPSDALDAVMPELLATAHTVYYALDAADGREARIRGWLDAVRKRSRSGARPPEALRDLTPLLDEMRLVKDATELDKMRRAARISAQAHIRAMQACRPGMSEFAIEAELLYVFRRYGAQAPAYTSIVASGANACVLHYPAGDALVGEGDLVLIDAGCELDGYAADITRTFPACGVFSPAQRELYDIVLASHRAAVAATRAGARFDDPHQAALRVLAQGMLDTGLLSADRHGTLDDVLESQAYRRFYMHRTSHWLGMDVHDCGDYRDPPGDAAKAAAERPSRTLAPGMVLTIEPGMYVRAAADVPQRFHDLGMRIEDDAVVTAGGCELITADVPVAADEIEALMAGACAAMPQNI